MAFGCRFGLQIDICRGTLIFNVDPNNDMFDRKWFQYKRQQSARKFGFESYDCISAVRNLETSNQEESYLSPFEKLTCFLAKTSSYKQPLNTIYIEHPVDSLGNCFVGQWYKWTILIGLNNPNISVFYPFGFPLPRSLLCFSGQVFYIYIYMTFQYLLTFGILHCFICF